MNLEAVWGPQHKMSFTRREREHRVGTDFAGAVEIGR